MKNLKVNIQSVPKKKVSVNANFDKKSKNTSILFSRGRITWEILKIKSSTSRRVTPLQKNLNGNVCQVAHRRRALFNSFYNVVIFRKIYSRLKLKNEKLNLLKDVFRIVKEVLKLKRFIRYL